jgi:hypothetical protein
MVHLPMPSRAYPALCLTCADAGTYEEPEAVEHSPSKRSRADWGSDSRSGLTGLSTGPAKWTVAPSRHQRMPCDVTPDCERRSSFMTEP